ncbi:bacillithiol system redox-active protein YtxJ [Paenisporosarcina indica]|uniref:bacillithiol system redox-active protein YtxJ n=1 Tax=Paenisporosarcina indica TaxID=650093 RepID=UPI00094FCED7|nr:bacillithiol system redox-active protein YtxJ [Paenisporosarcina indica]
MTNYKEITTIPEWENVLQQSKDKPVLVFKHSTTCPISAAAYSEFTALETNVDAYLVKVIESRPVSNEIESNLSIQHQSPQAFVISNEHAVWNASHRNITQDNITKALSEV